MGTVWKREDWNDIIRRVNGLIENPDTGCDELEPLEEVTENHIWTPDDIITVRDKLVEICPDNVFEAETVKWKKDIINEINDAIEGGWCGCCPPWPGLIEYVLPVHETITETTLLDKYTEYYLTWGIDWPLQLMPNEYYNVRYLLRWTSAARQWFRYGRVSSMYEFGRGYHWETYQSRVVAWWQSDWWWYDPSNGIRDFSRYYCLLDLEGCLALLQPEGLTVSLLIGGLEEINSAIDFEIVDTGDTEVRCK